MQITFNGKSYNSIEEMPANERQAYESMFQIFKDENGNGIPDFMEGDMVKNVMNAFTSNVVYNGKVYTNMDELPPEARQKLNDAMGKLNQLGVVTNVPAAQTRQPFDPAFKPSKPLIPQEPVIEESRNWVVIIGFLAALLVCAVGIAIGIFFMR